MLLYAHLACPLSMFAPSSTLEMDGNFSRFMKCFWISLQNTLHSMDQSQTKTQPQVDQMSMSYW